MLKFATQNESLIRAELDVDGDGDLCLRVNGEGLLYIGGQDGKIYRFTDCSNKLRDLGFPIDRSGRVVDFHTEGRD